MLKVALRMVLGHTPVDAEEARRKLPEAAWVTATK